MVHYLLCCIAVIGLVTNSASPQEFSTGSEEHERPLSLTRLIENPALYATTTLSTAPPLSQAPFNTMPPFGAKVDEIAAPPADCLTPGICRDKRQALPTPQQRVQSQSQPSGNLFSDLFTTVIPVTYEVERKSVPILSASWHPSQQPPSTPLIHSMQPSITTTSQADYLTSSVCREGHRAQLMQYFLRVRSDDSLNIHSGQSATKTFITLKAEKRSLLYSAFTTTTTPPSDGRKGETAVPTADCITPGACREKRDESSTAQLLHGRAHGIIMAVRDSVHSSRNCFSIGLIRLNNSRVLPTSQNLRGRAYDETASIPINISFTTPTSPLNNTKFPPPPKTGSTRTTPTPYPRPTTSTSRHTTPSPQKTTLSTTKPPWQTGPPFQNPSNMPHPGWSKGSGNGDQGMGKGSSGGDKGMGQEHRPQKGGGETAANSADCLTQDCPQ